MLAAPWGTSLVCWSEELNVVVPLGVALCSLPYEAGPGSRGCSRSIPSCDPGQVVAAGLVCSSCRPSLGLSFGDGCLEATPGL